MSGLRAVVIGGGSIGCRHAKNLLSLGVNDVTIVEPNEERRKTLAAEVSASLEESIAGALSKKPDMAFICTPPSMHVEHALSALTAGAHLFIEKPLSNDLAAIDRLIVEAGARSQIVQVGYNLRFIPALVAIRQMTDEQALGRLLWGRFESGQYLPDWRPWQDYRTSYTARSELGGGIVLDGSHEIDLALWMFGQVESVSCLAAKVSDLEMDVEDSATMTLQFLSGAYADVHLDCIQRAYSRELKLCFENGTVRWSWPENVVRVFEVGKGERVIDPPEGYVANDMYLDEARAFLAKVRGGGDMRSLNDGRNVIDVALAALKSSREGCRISIGEKG